MGKTREQHSKINITFLVYSLAGSVLPLVVFLLALGCLLLSKDVGYEVGYEVEAIAHLEKLLQSWSFSS